MKRYVRKYEESSISDFKEKCYKIILSGIDDAYSSPHACKYF
jgi:hypothetical protein